ncbi:hypothetical protein BU24DRAFT_426211 [Aaosphaeria arxii CBS 175.79]|uniref:Uncharacterized protein n=1 Tax=Aaosphaeria arxii CBS 175.79 TaxID=1450172 RepID=A0A6A5XHT6_9PLEO|nr:uncharacterized protein BU24DRAFT_426211 [Aaosphaeria arxii CBS 175.79]KAF2012340.1 hypothetical protein BU24DRAFT_426211 [Aaosphaeria arxii CBS 175.79]
MHAFARISLGSIRFLHGRKEEFVRGRKGKKGCRHTEILDIERLACLPNRPCTLFVVIVISPLVDFNSLSPRVCKVCRIILSMSGISPIDGR